MKRNWMPLYIPDFLADTMHLSAAETGAYLCLIMDYWLHDGLPDDDRKLAMIARVQPKSWKEMRPTIQAFFRDGWHHKRIDAELMKMIGMTERRRAAGSKGGTISSIMRSNASSKRQANVKQTPKQTVKQNEANVQHTTQERIINTSLEAARASENLTKSVSPTDDLATVIAKKGWLR